MGLDSSATRVQEMKLATLAWVICSFMACNPPLFRTLCTVLPSILSSHLVDSSHQAIPVLCPPTVTLQTNHNPISVFKSIALCVWRDHIHLSGLQFDAACSLLSPVASIPLTRANFRRCHMSSLSWDLPCIRLPPCTPDIESARFIDQLSLSGLAVRISPTIHRDST